MPNQIVLIDLSSIVFPIHHMTSDDPNPNATSIQTLDRIRSLASGQPYVAICTDSKRSVRREADPTYKANRKPEDRAPLYHQIAIVIETLRKEGFPIWEADGYEADDVIASATRIALETADATVQIVSADKDLLALVNDRVTLKSLKDGSVIDAAVVKAKFKVTPEQIHDYLCLVGDASDNIKGADKIGPVTAEKLLSAYGSLDGIYAAWSAKPDQFTPGIQASLGTFLSRVDDVKNLVRLRADLPIPFQEIAVERQVPMFDLDEEESPFAADTPTGLPSPAPVVEPPPAVHEPTLGTPRVELPPAAPAKPRKARRVIDAPPAVVDAVKPPDPTAPVRPVVEHKPAPDPVEPIPAAPAPEPARGAAQLAEAFRSLSKAPVPQVIDAEYTRQLEPVSMSEATTLAKYAFESRLYGAYGTAQGVLMTIMAGRELGMSAMHSLRAFHVISGKPVLAADAIRALVLRSGLAKYFRCTERTPERATFATKRGDDPEISLSFSMDEARAAGLVKDGSGWKSSPMDMMVARASVKLARLVFPDVVHGLYEPGEIE